MTDDGDYKPADPILEVPPPPDSPVTSVGTLFADDSLAVTTAKFSIAESLLNLMVRDCKFSDFMREILVIILKVVKSEAGSILEVDHANNVIFFRASVGQVSDQITRFVIPMGQGIVGHVAESRQPLVVSDIQENKIHLKAIQEAVGFPARNLVAVPIIVRGKIYGVLELLNRIGETNYTNADLDLLRYACELAAKAIEIRLMLAWVAKQNAEKGGKAA